MYTHHALLEWFLSSSSVSKAMLEVLQKNALGGASASISLCLSLPQLAAAAPPGLFFLFSQKVPNNTFISKLYSIFTIEK